MAQGSGRAGLGPINFVLGWIRVRPNSRAMGRPTDLGSDGKLLCRIADIDLKRADHIEQTANKLLEWRPEIEGVVEDLSLEVGKLTKHWDHSVIERSMEALGVISARMSAAARPSAGAPADGPSGHRDNMTHRKDLDIILYSMRSLCSPQKVY
jgi:hypothetical protein